MIRLHALAALRIMAAPETFSAACLLVMLARPEGRR